MDCIHYASVISGVNVGLTLNLVRILANLSCLINCLWLVMLLICHQFKFCSLGLNTITNNVIWLVYVCIQIMTCIKINAICIGNDLNTNKCNHFHGTSNMLYFCICFDCFQIINTQSKMKTITHIYVLSCYTR